MEWNKELKKLANKRLHTRVARHKSKLSKQKKTREKGKRKCKQEGNIRRASRERWRRKKNNKK